LWDIAFAGGSITAAFMQGVILGGLLHGLPVKDGHFGGGMLDWLQPFPLFVGFATVAGYALLGATWLVMRTTGEVAAQAREQARGLLFVVLAAMVIVSLWTPLSSDRIWERWFTLPNFIYLSPIPILTAVSALTVWRGLVNGHDNAPFFGTVALFLLGFAGLAISTLPYLVPPTVTIWDAAAHPSSQLFMLIGTAAFLPLILGYTAFVYWTFRGKVKPGEGYH
jgi:cytochrome d ubiquinol oxidase subunit II